jgi:hypothetical protein
MRRKVIQDFANVFCQKFIQLPNGYDIASFAHYGSGNYYMNILSGDCFYNETKIPTLETCKEHKDWLTTQLEKRDFTISNIQHAHLEARIEVSNITVGKEYHHYFAGAIFSFDRNSKIETDEIAYVAHQFHQQTWEFGWFYEKLYGSLEDLAKQ